MHINKISSESLPTDGEITGSIPGYVVTFATTVTIPCTIKYSKDQVENNTKVIKGFLYLSIGRDN